MKKLINSREYRYIWFNWSRFESSGNSISRLRFKFPTSYPRIQDGGRWRERTRDRDVGLGSKLRCISKIIHQYYRKSCYIISHTKLTLHISIYTKQDLAWKYSRKFKYFFSYNFSEYITIALYYLLLTSSIDNLYVNRYTNCVGSYSNN